MKIIYFFILSVCHFDHGKTDYLVAEGKAPLEHFDYLVFAEALVLNVHDRIVLFGVELLALRCDLGDAESVHRGFELRHYHLDALAVRLVRSRLL